MCPERYVYQGFCASRRKSGIRIFHFPVIFRILCRAKKNLHVVFILTGKQLFDGKHSSPKGLFFLRGINDFGSQNRPGSIFAIFAVRTAKVAQNAFWAPKGDFYGK